MFDNEGNIHSSFQNKLNYLFPEEDLSGYEYNQVTSEQLEIYTATPAQVLSQIKKASNGSSSG